jgi:hypothetical protein
VAYYVSLGARGVLLRIGTSLIGVLGGLVYWCASRRRRLSPESGSANVSANLVRFVLEVDPPRAERGADLDCSAVA